MDDKVYKDLREALRFVAKQDVNGCLRGETEYERSWMKRGGVGAFFTLVRSMDRLDSLCSRQPEGGDRYDIFLHCLQSDGDTGVLNAVRDLRRYLLLVEAELVRQGHELPLQRHNKEDFSDEAD